MKRRMLLLAFVSLGLVCSGFAVHDSAEESSGENNRTIRLLVLLPQTPGSSFKYAFGAEMAGSAVFSAFDDIRKNNLLPGINVEADFGNSGCNGVQGLGAAYDMLTVNRYDGIIGPSCTQACRTVGRLAAHLNLPCFSGVCQDVEMIDKTQFTTLTRFLGTFEMTGLAVTKLLERFRWKRVGIIAEKKPDIIWLLARNGFHFAMDEKNITKATSTLLIDGSEIEQVLVDTAKVSRVIILAMTGQTFRETMRLAIKHNLNNGDYIFICVDFYKQRKILGDFDWQQGDEEDEQIRKMYTSVFFISYFVRDGSIEYTRFIETVTNGSMEHFNFDYGDMEVPYPAANIYEAAYLMGVAINETLADGGDIRDGKAVSRRLWGRSFHSITGELTLNENGDREQAYMIRHLQESGQVEVIGHYYSNGENLTLFPWKITWPGSREGPPPDTPPCGFEGEICAEDEYTRMMKMIGIFCGVFISFILVTIVTVAVIYRKMKLAKELADMRWKVDFNDVIRSRNELGKSRISQSVFSLMSGRTRDSTDDYQIQRFAQTGLYKGMVVVIKITKDVVHANLTDEKFLRDMKMIHDINNQNLTKFVGAVVEKTPRVHLLTEYCTKGSLQDLLENDDIKLDWTFKCSIMMDIIQGLSYLHGSFLKAHGNLKSSNCVVDGRFVVKLTDFGLFDWHHGCDKQAKDLLWTPPENLLQSKMGTIIQTEPCTSTGDIYALSLILCEVCCRQGPFYLDHCEMDSQDIVSEVYQKRTPALRPSIDEDEIPRPIAEIMIRGWSDKAANRPALFEIKAVVRRHNGAGGKTLSIMDNLLNRMEQYANNLEGLVEDRTQSYLEEKKRAEDLLHRLLPQSIASELQTCGRVLPQTFECVTIYFSDIVHFTALCSESTPMQVVDLLNDLYTSFDATIAEFDVYKVETIGDAYMAVSGLPTKNGDAHASQIALMSLALLSTVNKFKVPHRPDKELLLRIGIHSGPCVSGVVGLTMPRYCLFGDTVNTASRMESNGEPLKVHMSHTTFKLLQMTGGFTSEYRGMIPMKGKGEMKTYWLHGEE